MNAENAENAENAREQDAPVVSIIMPVFNTGAYLIEAVDSILDQRPVGGRELPSFELLVVDDHSTDPGTIEALERVSRLDARIRVLENQRKKGAAGARNTGIANARGTWVGFLDSDDLWFPDSLGMRWNLISGNPEVRWAGAHFRLLKPTADEAGKPVFESAASLFSKLEENRPEPELVRLRRPTGVFGESCMTGIMTVLVRRDLIVEKNLFEESLPRAEDYCLWFRCSFDNDLWMVEAEVAFYRIHPASLTNSDQPRHFHEDAMVELLLKEPLGEAHRAILIGRFDFVMQDQCYFYRGTKRFGPALRSALRWLSKRPFNRAAWKELVASGLKRG